MSEFEKRYKTKDKFQRRLNQVFLDVIGDREYSEVADIGCGNGFWTYVGARGKNFVNCSVCDVFDYFQKEEIQPLVNKLEYAHIPGDVLPYPDNNFDLVFSMDVIEHIEDDLKFIEEKIRIAKSGGKILFGTPNIGRISNHVLKLFGKLKFPRVLGKDVYGDVLHLREYTKKDLTDKISKFSNKIEDGSIQVIPCWYGVYALNMGVNRLPKIFESFCQYWLVEFRKK
jgi:SAM-dependent methyltransferase